MTDSGSLCSRSHCSANGSTSSLTKDLNSSCRPFCAPVSSCCPPLLSIRVPVLLQDKSRHRVQRLEILDVQIVRSHLDGKGLFDERHQLNGKQGIDDSRFKQVVVVIQFRDADRARYETLDGFFDSFFVCSSHRLFCMIPTPSIRWSELPD